MPRLVGTNAVTIRAYDAAGNSTWGAVIVVRDGEFQIFGLSTLMFRTSPADMSSSIMDLIRPRETTQPRRAEAFPTGDTEAVMLSLAKVVAERDNHTAGPCERLAFTGVALGVAMKLDSRSLLALYQARYLHDVGKVGIPDSILFRPGKLSDKEWETMRTHPVLGGEICPPLKSLRHVLPLIRHHHERLDGTGYPDGLRGPPSPYWHSCYRPGYLRRADQSPPLQASLHASARLRDAGRRSPARLA